MDSYQSIMFRQKGLLFMKVLFFACVCSTIEEAKKCQARDFALDYKTRTPFIEIDPETMTYWNAIDALNKTYETHPVLKECNFFALLSDGSIKKASEISWNQEV